MTACHFEQSLVAGPRVCVAADDCARHTSMVAPLNIQYHQYLQLTPLMRKPLGCQALMVILPNIQYPQYLQATPRTREPLGCQALQKAEAVHSVRIGNRRRISTKFWEVATSVVSRCARERPGNCQTAHGDELCGHVDQTDRIASGGCGWRRTRPPPWLFQDAGQRPMSASLAL